MTIIAQFCEETGDGCECISPVTGEYDIEIPAGNFSKTIQIEGTKPFTVKNISVDEWCTVTFNNGLKFEGSIESGSHKQVVQVENACGKAVIVVTITVSVECTGVIEKDIAIKDGVVSETIQVPGGEIISASVGTATATLYGTDLIIKGNASPGPYNVKMNDACGTIVSGDFYECIVPKLLNTTGIADFERQTPATFSWVIAGNSIKTKNPVLPAGLSVATTESGGQTTVTVSGTPSQNTGNGTMSVVVYNDCGTLTLTQKYTQAACKGIRVTGEEGDAAFEIGEEGEFCKIIEGYEPMNIVEFADVPRGMAATLTKIGFNKYKVCVTGTPVTDLCDDSQELSCKCSKVTVRNECGDTVVELCSSTVKPLPKPGYCAGVAFFTKMPANGNPFDNNVKIEVVGVFPNSTMTLTGTVATEMEADGEGYAVVETQYNIPESGEGGEGVTCIKVTHPTCAILVANRPTTIWCTSDGATSGTGGGGTTTDYWAYVSGSCQLNPAVAAGTTTYATQAACNAANPGGGTTDYWAYVSGSCQLNPFVSSGTPTYATQAACNAANSGGGTVTESWAYVADTNRCEFNAWDGGGTYTTEAECKAANGL